MSTKEIESQNSKETGRNEEKTEMVLMKYKRVKVSGGIWSIYVSGIDNGFIVSSTEDISTLSRVEFQ